MAHNEHGHLTGLFFKDKDQEEICAYGELSKYWKTIKLEKNDRLIGLKYKLSEVKAKDGRIAYGISNMSFIIANSICFSMKNYGQVQDSPTSSGFGCCMAAQDSDD